MPPRPFLRLAIAALAVPCHPAAARAQGIGEGGKLLLTNGITTIEGGSGGGLTPWATIAGNATKDGIGIQASATAVALDAYDHRGFAIAIGAWDRIELSYARQRFDTNAIGGALGLGENYAFDQDVYGIKVRLAGDIVYGAAAMPAIAMGAQYKRSLDGAVVRALGAADDRGVDFYASATKLVLARSVLFSATARATRANQTGLLGFGGDRRDGYAVQIEGTVAYQLSRRFAMGGEYRSKPDNLGVAREDDWVDLFAAYAIDRHLTATVAYTDLGSIATVPGQRGVLFQLQAGF